MFYLKNQSKIFLLISLIIFLSICIFTGLYYSDELLLGSFSEFNNDDVKYIRSAQTLIDTGRFTYNYPNKSTVFIMPGLVLFLLPFVKLFGMINSVLYFRVFLAIIQTFTLYIIFQIARKLFNNKVAVVALILNLLYIPHIYIANLILTETLFSFFLSLLFLSSIYAIYAKRARYYILGGVFLGLAVIFRPSIALYPIIIFVLWCKEGYKIKEMFYFGSLSVLFCFLILAPWWVRNAIVFDRFIPFTLSSGNPMLQGAFVNNNVNHELIAKLNDENLFYTDDEINNNEVETRMALKVYKYYFKTDFWRYIKWNTVDKTAINFMSPYYNGKLYGISYKMVLIQHIIYIGLGLVGIFKNFRENLLIVLIPVYFALVHLPFLAYSRYMYPVCAYMIILASSIIFKEDKSCEESTCDNSGI